ncbi:hypothetical protein HNQ60_001194 [Povalibacter uvarum]|uniref:Uncharacterized protein n=1 Tax=Povalibacter uvarum TaxID=732238 RepID=A0A841HJF3_9GAMM|nr:hypothetical protein [Povalibacter uvarum]MBB6092348.1 hypothetical protein [Povalibacter uvarum]
MHGKTSNGLDRAAWNRRNLALENALADPSVVIVALPGIGTLKLPKKLFDQHLLQESSAGSTDGPAPAQLLDAAQLEARTGIPATWWMNQARERRIPFHKYGRYVRFDFAEVMGCEAFKRREVKTTGYPILGRNSDPDLNA